MKLLALTAAAVLLGAAAPLWLDDSAPSNWNGVGAALPAAPGPRDPELAPGGRCASQVRPPSTPEDRALTAKGWFLIAPYERYGATSFVLATSSADGMCRPNGFQGFVFVNQAFAGTLAPHPMDARTDGSLEGWGLILQSANELSASFARYSASDALCCPHATTTVEYKVESKGGRAVLVPGSTSTAKNQ